MALFDHAAPILVAKQVNKSYGATPVLRDFSLKVARGETICLIGPSGSGKSTFLRCVNALTTIDDGSIEVAGIRVDDPRLDKPALRRAVGIVFQQYNLFPHRTVLQNVTMAPIQVLGRDRREVEAEARALLDKVGLADKARSYPGELSGGQQQRVAIARSLAVHPQVMLFDEVTAALDPEKKKDVLDTIRALAGDGLTRLVVTHEIGFSREAADRVCFTDGGRIVEEGPPEQVLGSPIDERTRRFLQHHLSGAH
jgi:polar amino acid transport system ATP-binding protein